MNETEIEWIHADECAFVAIALAMTIIFVNGLVFVRHLCHGRHLFISRINMEFVNAYARDLRSFHICVKKFLLTDPQSLTDNS